ncbi:amino acid transporter [candidate division GN15 bacterium]|uniref:Amino acid transporter n=1 Tax=candidate division GN15 bacterium TaxID=2072418 RepID=A0A855X927_9BACT|nr:MAG: amino acid transporter [candidate division GN15 bacterium]
MNNGTPVTRRLKQFFIGGSRDLQDRSLFHALSLTAFLAWIGLGADGLSSSCYGPEEAFLTLGGHNYLGLLVAFGSAITVFVISASYSQIIELFPTGGGGYLVASKMLNPTLGMVSGCALMIDYVLTIALSVASGTDAFFSFLPVEYQSFKLVFACAGVILLIVMNLRGVRESVVPLIPIMLAFVFLHAFAIVYSFFDHAARIPQVIESTARQVSDTGAALGTFGLLFLLLKSYSFGAGTYTGIEAVSNGLPVIREPRVENGRRTMRYMAISLAFMVTGLMTAYLLYHVEYTPGRTLNAVLFESISASWHPSVARAFVLTTLLSEAALLFVAAQTGFLGGPRVLANMAIDRWFPTRFTMLSDRLVTQNGILLMGGAALALLIATGSSVKFLVVLYSITVFITFFLSQLGMVRHWWEVRKTFKRWIHKITINGIGLTLTTFILITVSVLKFNDGGWLTLLVTGLLVAIALRVRRHYRWTERQLGRLNELMVSAAAVSEKHHANSAPGCPAPPCDPKARTAVLLVNGFNGLGIHTLLNVMRLFEGSFKNFVFAQVGVVDVGNFKGSSEVEHLKEHIESEGKRYVNYLRHHGIYAESRCSIGVDVVDELEQLVTQIREQFPQSVLFGGQLVFEKENFTTRMLHNYTIFAVQKRLYHQGIPIVILPIRV